jgi:hypothetical protein
MPAQRWIPHRRSSSTALLIEEVSCATPGQNGWQQRIHRRIVWSSKRDHAPPRERHECGRTISFVRSVARLNQFGDYFTSVGYKHALACPHGSHEFAQTILQFSKAHGLHHDNVAP